RGREFLALEKHRRARRQKPKRGKRPMPAGRGQGMPSQTAGRISDLVMVLQKGDELRSVQVEPGRTAKCFLARVPLALVEVTPLDQRNELLRRSLVVTEVILRMTCGGDAGDMVEIVIPAGVAAVTVLIERPQGVRVLVFIFEHDQRAS